MLKQKGVASPLIIVIVLLVIFVGYIYTQKSNDKGNVTKAPVTALSPSAKPSTETSPRARTKFVKLSEAWNQGTKTFTSSKINISFEYPSYFLIDEVDIEKENREWAETYKNNPDVKQPRYTSSFAANFHTNYAGDPRETCPNTMRVHVAQDDNRKNLTLYDFIADMNKAYAGGGVTETFETYKKNLFQSKVPKATSYVWIGDSAETPAKEVYFEHNGKVFLFILRGYCDTGGKYSKDAENVFDNMLKSIKFL